VKCKLEFEGCQETVNSPWLTTEESALYLKLYTKEGKPNTSYIYKLVSSGLLKTYKLGKFNRFKREDLDALHTGQ
jgi:excisionase family DNA binding protein